MRSVALFCLLLLAQSPAHSRRHLDTNIKSNGVVTCLKCNVQYSYQVGCRSVQAAATQKVAHVDGTAGRVRSSLVFECLVARLINQLLGHIRLTQSQKSEATVRTTSA